MDGWILGNTPEHTGEYWVIIPGTADPNEPQIVLTWYSKLGREFWVEAGLYHGHVLACNVIAYKPAVVPDIPNEMWEAVENFFSTKFKEEML